MDAQLKQDVEDLKIVLPDVARTTWSDTKECYFLVRIVVFAIEAACFLAVTSLRLWDKLIKIAIKKAK
jgi:hypothetical protein